MSDQHDNTRFDQLRREEQEERRDLVALDRDGGEGEAATDGPEPGHLGNDLSRMTLLETDLEAVANQDDEVHLPEVQQALADLEEIPVRQYVAESDG